MISKLWGPREFYNEEDEVWSHVGSLFLPHFLVRFILFYSILDKKCISARLRFWGVFINLLHSYFWRYQTILKTFQPVK